MFHSEGLDVPDLPAPDVDRAVQPVLGEDVNLVSVYLGYVWRVPVFHFRELGLEDGDGGFDFFDRGFHGGGSFRMVRFYFGTWLL